VFEANPAGCPAVSIVGHVIVYTPSVAGPVGRGPVYLGLHGGEAFPDLVMVLQGDGVVDVTPDGRFLVFTSHRVLTVDDTCLDGPA
jgi:hypothetical protein